MNSYLASDGREAVSLATVRSQLGSVAKIIAGYTLLPMVYLFGGEKTMTSKGMLLTAFVTTLVCFLLFENLYRATRGMDAEATAKESVKASDMIKAAVTSRPLMLVLLAEIARVITIFMIMALFPFFFKYVVGDPTKASTFFGVTYILAFFGATIVPFLAKKISKRNIYAAGMLLFAAMMFAMFVFSDNPTFVIMLACVGYFGYSWGDTINTAILTDISDYTEYKTGASCRALRLPRRRRKRARISPSSTPERSRSATARSLLWRVKTTRAPSCCARSSTTSATVSSWSMMMRSSRCTCTRTCPARC